MISHMIIYLYFFLFPNKSPNKELFTVTTFACETLGFVPNGLGLPNGFTVNKINN